MTDSKPAPSKPQSKNPLAASLLQMAGQSNVITVRRPFVAFTGSLEAAMLLDQLLYWTPRSVMGGWIAKSDAELQDELCLKRYSVRAARDRLVEMKLVEVDVRRFNNFPTQHYRVNMAVLTSLWSEFVSRLCENEQTVCAFSNSRLSENEQTLTETTYRDLNDEEEKNVQTFQISTELQAELKELGIFVSVWRDVEKRIAEGWTESDLVALMDWMTGTRKDKTKAAQGFVARLREGTTAPKEYYAFSKRRTLGKWYPGPEQTGTAQQEEQEPDPEPTVQPVYWGDVGSEIVSAWESVLGQLAQEMARSTFTKYVIATAPIRFADDTLFVCAENVDARDWLESRITSTAERLLVGILNQSVTVEFVASETIGGVE